MRNLQTWTIALEEYFCQLFENQPEIFKKSRNESDKLMKLGISLGQTEASLLSFLVKLKGCLKFIEIGTLTGHSALWILKALPQNARLWTFEKDPVHAKVAREILSFDQRATVIEGDAQEMLIEIEAQGPFDGIFIDGNKAAYLNYLVWAEKNLSKGSLIIADNVFLGGRVFGLADSRFSDKQVEVMKKFNQRLADPGLYESALVPTPEGLFIAIMK